MDFSISFIVPFRNERQSLPEVLHSLISQVMDQGHVAQILLVDGISSDGSADIVKNFITENSLEDRWQYLTNEKIVTPAAFNIGITHSKASVIGLGGAHTIYPSEYLRNALKIIRDTDAVVVGGGHSEIIPDKDTRIGIAMTWLYRSPMGMGVAKYHRAMKPVFVDTVYGGIYERRIFEEVGLFNETLAKNQDNELNARITAAGHKILYDPSLSTKYIIKTGWKHLLRRASGFSRFHISTWKANPKSFRWRHLVPALFVLYLLAALFLSIILSSRILVSIVIIPLVMYILLLIAASIPVLKKDSTQTAALVLFVFCVTHVIYGFSFFRGFPSLWKKA